MDVVTRTVAHSLTFAIARDVRDLAAAGLRRLVLGVRCDTCGDYYRGPRTLFDHNEAEHVGDPA